jgi:formylglycine-generating enzyme required for sulfatase activity
LSLLVIAGCDETKPTKTAPEPTPSVTVTATATATAAASAPTVEVHKGEHGPVVTIPKGTLEAGSKCMDVPRSRPDELLYEDVALGEFQMDVYPYPNEPNKPALVNVTWEKAKQLCEERGKRLCTEMEWERACKGPKNLTYMWGNGFKTKRCDGQKDLLNGARPECKTEFGVMDMVGGAMEWTASEWERGTPSGHKVVRGARAEKVS